MRILITADPNFQYFEFFSPHWFKVVLIVFDIMMAAFFIRAETICQHAKVIPVFKSVIELP